MSTSPPESYGLDQMDEVRDILSRGRFTRRGDEHFLWKFLGLTSEDKVIRSYTNFKQSTGYTGEEAIQQYFMSAGLIAKDESEHYRDKLFDFLNDALSGAEERYSKEDLESVYYNLEK